MDIDLKISILITNSIVDARAAQSGMRPPIDNNGAAARTARAARAAAGATDEGTVAEGYGIGYGNQRKDECGTKDGSA